MISPGEIGERIKQAAKRKGITNKALLQECGLSKNGVPTASYPQSDTLIKFADALGCSTDYLLGRAELGEDYGEKCVSGLSPQDVSLLGMFQAITDEAMRRMVLKQVEVVYNSAVGSSASGCEREKKEESPASLRRRAK